MQCVPAICEKEGGLFGVAGKCNNNTGLCECPEGFNGNDVLVMTQSCRVNVDAYYSFSVVLLITAVATAISTIWMFISTFMRWEMHEEFRNWLLPGRRRSQSLTTEPSDHAPMSLVFPSTSRTLERPRYTKEQGSRYLGRRKRWIMVTLFITCLTPLLHFPYVWVCVFDPPVQKHATSVFMPQALAFSCVPTSMWTVAYAYYLTLPDLERLRKILQVDSILFNRDKGELSFILLLLHQRSKNG